MPMFALKVALRYLFSKKTHGAVNVISLISVIGVAVATMAVVCVLSVFNGFTDLALSKISHLAPDLRVEPAVGAVIENADSLSLELLQLEYVELAQPTIEQHALAIYDTRQMPVSLKGVVDDYNRLTGIESLIKEDGSYVLNISPYGEMALLSVGAAIGLDAHPGLTKYMALYVPRREGRINTVNPMSSFRSDSLMVSGVFQVEQAEYDTDLVIVPISVARYLLDLNSHQASAIEMKLKEGVNHEVAVAAIVALLGSGYEVKNRLAQHEQSFKMISVEKWITFTMLAFILIIASFNVISTLSMLVIEKDENIHTLYSLGASRAMIARIFHLEGWLISLVGGVVGIVVGILLCFAQQFGQFIELGGNHEAMSIEAYPVRVELIDQLAVLVLVALVGWLTSTVTSIFTRRRLR